MAFRSKAGASVLHANELKALQCLFKVFFEVFAWKIELDAEPLSIGPCDFSFNLDGDLTFGQ
jgi:hypothetical protein